MSHTSRMEITVLVVLIWWQYLPMALSASRFSESTSNTTRILQRLQHLYANPKMRPLEGTDTPVIVNVSMYIQHLRISDPQATFMSMDLYMRHKWNDPRLKYENGPDHIILHGDSGWMWLPDLFISNSINVELHGGVRPSYGFKLYPNGDVLRSSRLSIKTQCEMNLRNFPMDSQICELNVESYMHSADHIELAWMSNTNAVGVSDTAASPPAFVLLKVDHSTRLISLSANKFHTLRVLFHMKRLSSHYIVMTYIPCIFVVALSCLIFWMPVTSLAERAFYGAFLFLATVLLVVSSQYGSPQVGYLKAIDIWGICCLAFVFCAVLEVMVLHLLRRGAMDNGDNRLDQFELMKEDELGKIDQQPHLGSSRPVHPNLLRRVDLAFRLVYPAAFVLFNAIYWATYTN